ncbi:hypothetical protein F6R97_28200 [Pseudomonas sp. JV414]|uniref:hypothetical protein n=1 Tax=Pseudomonas sp. JV414 TaxID=1733110 RepID=UPI0028E15E92|nr:hypothetical protein [Pseudomonas sp. JV414]MDT9678391.1 hypothetical protein [Pseudomonas sp. JV414]
MTKKVSHETKRDRFIFYAPKINLPPFANGGAAKYSLGTDIEALERHAFKNGQEVNNGKPWKVIDIGKTIGANDGEETRFMRVELSANTIHGHPISEEAFKKLTKAKKN